MNYATKNPLRGQPVAGYRMLLEKLYGSKNTTKRFGGQFDRSCLPDPLEYYREHLHRLRLRGQWADAVCPFHEDKQASLSVNTNHGGWKCHAGCGSGDLLSFHERLTGQSFVEAAKDLGAWRDII